MKISERIAIDEKICNGKPVIRETRITVQTILEFLAAGESPTEILIQYPSPKANDIQAALKFAAIELGRNYSIQ